MQHSIETPSVALREDAWVADSNNDDDREIYHLNGVPHNEAPIPFFIHQCKVQTEGWITPVTFVEHCACGGTRDTYDWFWHNKNRRLLRKFKERLDTFVSV